MSSIKKNVNFMRRRLSRVLVVKIGCLHLRRSIAFVFSIILFNIILDWAWAADRIWLEPTPPTAVQGDWFPRTIEVFSGRVAAFDSQRLRVVREGQDAEMVISAARVLWIEPDQVSELETNMISLFKQREYAKSLSGLPDALQNRPAVWRQQWLTMLSANSAWKSGRASIGLELVGQLDRRPLPAMVLAWLPIAWENGAQPATVVRAANERLQDPSAAVRLVAASWLLSSTDRKQGLQAIKELVKDPETSNEISQLARILSWRVTPPPQVAALRIEWEKQIDALPMAIQTGPTRLLMNKLQTSGQAEEAKRLKLSLELTPIYGLKQLVIDPINQ